VDSDGGRVSQLRVYRAGFALSAAAGLVGVRRGRQTGPQLRCTFTFTFSSRLMRHSAF
jgi:hypothetical protein